MNPSSARTTEAGWWDRPWRLIQTNLRERDMEDIDAEGYVESLRGLHATVAMINTSGIIASYPTSLPFHTQSAFLRGEGLATIIEACHGAEIKVIARADFSKVRLALHELHPEWAYRRTDGGIVDEEGDVWVCPSGGYQQECAPRIVEETITELDVDGIFFNMTGFQTHDYRGIDHGLCHCEACIEGFRIASGLELPTASDIEDPTYRRYIAFTGEVVRSSKQRMEAMIRRLRPDLAIDRPTDDLGGFVRQESNTALDRPLPDWQYGASANTKWVVSSLPRTVSSNASVDFVDYPVRHVAVSPERQRLRLAQALANGGGLDYYVIGRLDHRHDRTGAAAVRDLFGYHAAHEDEYRDLRSCARVALLTGAHGNADEFRGWFRVLAEYHFLFDVLLVDAATDEHLARYDVVILPDHEPLSDDAAARLDRFVEGGGTLVSSGRSGWRDEDLEPRDVPVLACLGIERIREICDVRGAYLRVGDRDSFPRLAGTDLVFLDGPYVDAEYRPEATSSLLSLIPPGPFGPPERLILPEATDAPGLTINPFGEGRGIHVPWNCGALFHRNGHPNTSDFIADVLERLTALEPVAGNLSPMVEVTLHERGDGSSHLLHLVNGSGHFGVSYVEPVTMLDLEVVFPYEGEPADVTALVAGQPLEWHGTGRSLSIHVPKLGLFEAIAISGRREHARP
ncbi:MAG: beta-galactosidase trimerization domain-containing protein [Actinomycetota bacterium]